MEQLTESQRIQAEEAERTPNQYAARALLVMLITLFAACLLNEMHVFEVDRITIWICFCLAVLFWLIVRFLSHSEKYSIDPRSKYVILVCSLLLTLAVTIFLTNNVILLFILPMLLATQYRSMRISYLAVFGSALCSVVSPLVSWWIGSWSLNVMTGYLETVCKVSVQELGPSALSNGEAVFNLLVYLSLPQLMIIAIFGFIFLAITRNSINGMKNRVHVIELSRDLNDQLEHVVSMQDQILYAISDIIENRDDATGGHVKRTSEVVRILLNAMKQSPELHLTESFCTAVEKAAPLHDLGKIAVDDAILRKPGGLTQEERAVIQQHPGKSAEIIRQILSGLEDEEFIRIAVNLAEYHHEWYDGSGYPAHLKGEEIPLEARIMAIADVYDALVSTRSYKEPMDREAAFRVIEESMGTQFDPALNPYFIQVLPQIEAYYSE